MIIHTPEGRRFQSLLRDDDDDDITFELGRRGVKRRGVVQLSSRNLCATSGRSYYSRGFAAAAANYSHVVAGGGVVVVVSVGLR